MLSLFTCCAIQIALSLRVSREIGTRAKPSQTKGRIAPAKDLGIERQQDKIAWLWNATNAFIDDFKDGAGKDRTLTVRSEDLFSNAEEAERILNWLDFKGR
jgi:hypothetical protein